MWAIIYYGGFGSYLWVVSDIPGVQYKIYVSYNGKKNDKIKKNPHGRTRFEKSKDQNHIIFFTLPKQLFVGNIGIFCLKP